MANSKSKIKNGMRGSNGGRNRYEKTRVLKNDSKKRRRQIEKDIIMESKKRSICSNV